MSWTIRWSEQAKQAYSKWSVAARAEFDAHLRVLKKKPDWLAEECSALYEELGARHKCKGLGEIKIPVPEDGGDEKHCPQIRALGYLIPARNEFIIWVASHKMEGFQNPGIFYERNCSRVQNYKIQFKGREAKFDECKV